MSLGPNLFGVFGRTMGTEPDYLSRYTSALKESGKVLDAETLISYMIDPKGFVPGTKMPRQRVSEERRLDLVAYLQTLK